MVSTTLARSSGMNPPSRCTSLNQTLEFRVTSVSGGSGLAVGGGLAHVKMSEQIKALLSSTPTFRVHIRKKNVGRTLRPEIISKESGTTALNGASTL